MYCLNPVIIYYGNTTNAEASYIFYFILSCYFFLQYLQNSSKKKYLYYFFISTTVAVATKDQASFLLIGLVAWIVINQPRHALYGCILGLLIFHLIYILWGGIHHLPNHIVSMRENSKLFEVYSIHPLDLLRLTRDFCWDLLRTLGPTFLIGSISLMVCNQAPKIKFVRNVVVMVLIPYFLAILFLAHRSNPRYVLPFLPLLAMAGGLGIHHFCNHELGRCIRWILVAILGAWTLGFTIHLHENPRDSSKRLIRNAITTQDLPKNSRLCLFTKRVGIQYVVQPDGTMIPDQRLRDWIWEKYGWVSQDVRLLTLLPEDQIKVQNIKPELIGIFDSDPISRPIPGYRKLHRFKNKFPQLYGYIYPSEEIELYAADHLKLTVLKDGSFY